PSLMITAFLGYERSAPCGASSFSASSLSVASGPIPIDTACDKDMASLPDDLRRNSGTARAACAGPSSGRNMGPPVRGETPMKRLAPALALLFAASLATAQTLDDLKNDGRNTDNILTYGMGYAQQRYSPLSQVSKTTVKRLVPVWNLSLDNNWGEQAQP